MTELRDYQTRVMDEVARRFRAGLRRVLVVSPTGSGKTVMFAWLAARTALKGKRVLILVHRIELLWQTSRTLDAMGVEHGILKAGTREAPPQRIVVAMVQTLGIRITKARTLATVDGTGPAYPIVPDLIITDEAHHAVAGTWENVHDAFPWAFHIGFTATPLRLDGKGLAAVYDDLVLGPAVADLIERSYLADYVCYSKPPPDLRGLHRIGGDFVASELEARMLPLMGDAVEHYRRHADGLPAIGFCVSIAHAEAMADTFAAAGYRAFSVDGAMPQKRRDERISGLADGRTQVLMSCALVSEGLDIPAVAAALLYAPTMSLAKYLQQVGRALRPKETGGKAIILDHAGNVDRHGLPDQRRKWILTVDKMAGEVDPVKTCPECFATIPRGANPCPVCSYDASVDATGKEASVLPGFAPGELVKIDRIRNPSRETIAEELAKCKSEADVYRLAVAFGYKKGWGWHAWLREMERRKAAGRNDKTFSLGRMTFNAEYTN